MRSTLFFIFFVTSFFVKSQSILSDTVLDVNCYHDGAVYTKISSLDTNTFSKWYYAQDTVSWILLDTTYSGIYLNNTNFTSDTVLTTFCGYYKLELVNAMGVLQEYRIYDINCKLIAFSDVEIIQCYNDIGSIIIDSIHGGVSPYNFEWYYNNIIRHDTVNFIDSLDGGLYKVIITDSIECMDTITINLSNPNRLLIDTIIINDVKCYGDSSASIFVSVSGGRKITVSNRYRYYLLMGNDTISQSDTNNITQNFVQNAVSLDISSSIPDSITINNLVSDSFRILILDSSVCMLDTVIFISQPDPYVLYPSSNFPMATCSSDSIWFIIDSISGGNIPFLYSIEYTTNIHEANSRIINDSIYISSGDYSFYINDTINLCSDTLSFSISALYDINTNISTRDVLCNGDSTGSIIIDSIFGGVFPYNINFYGVISDSLSVGSYPIEIIDSLMCIFRDTIIISEPEVIYVDNIIQSPICYADTNASISLIISGGLLPYEVDWDNGLSNDTLFNILAGDYIYTVTDSNGCIYSDTIQILDPESISIDFTNYIDSLSCFGGSTTIEAVVNGYDSTYSILWSNNDTLITTTIFSGITTCTVIDNNNCITIDSVTILEPDIFRILELVVIDTSCNDGITIVQAEAIGGTAPYDYKWYTEFTDSVLPGETLQQAFLHDSISLCWVIVTDSCGNSDSAGVSLTPFILETSLYYNDSTHIAFINIDNSTSNGPFFYVWDHLWLDSISIDSFSVINQCEEIYYVTITDAISGCFVIDTLEAHIYLPNSLVDLSVTSVLPIDSLWGYEPYTYEWNNGSNLSYVDDICPGFHWVEVTDSDGCMIRETFEIEPILISLDPPGLIIECDIKNEDINIEATVTGGTAPYSYEWFNGFTGNPLDIILNPGNYSIMVRDNNGCYQDTIFMIATMIEDCIPNIFTPNGDNVNDIWKLEESFLYSDTEIKVYGRYGRLLFHSVGYEYPWDGKDIKGRNVRDGVYFYSIELGNGFPSIKGTVSIIR